MSDHLKDILANLSNEVPQEKLLDYLQQKLPPSEEHEVEKQMTDDEFMNDAVEGLEKFNNKKALPQYVEQLNRDLHKQLAKRKMHREKRKLKEQPWVYFTVILILLLVIIAYLVIKKMK